MNGLLASMSYFLDMTPHTYTPADGLKLLNVGWLDEAYPFARGVTPAEFRTALLLLCEQPVYLHRGFHTCQFCPKNARHAQAAGIGNGQIRVMGADGTWYAAPTMIHHYVTAHNYLPPAAFVEAVLRPAAVAEGNHYPPRVRYL
jgi:hypothetical protein